MRQNRMVPLATSFRQKVILVIFGIFLFFVLLEIGLRIGEKIFLFIQERGNRTAIKQGGEYRIICLGESTTALGGQDSYSRQLEEILNQQNIGIRFKVINKGIPGITTSDILMRLEDNLYKCKPNMVITMMGINDMRNYMPGKDNSVPGRLLRFFRTYKLIGFLWLRGVTKFREMGICKSKDGIRPKSKLQTILSDVGWQAYDNLDAMNYPYAEEAFKKALELDPASDASYIVLGWLYNNQGKYLQAEEAFKKALELDPASDASYLALGWLYNNQGKYLQAEEAFKKAFKLNRGNYKAFVALGWLYNNQGKYLQAEELFKKAIGLSPDNDNRAYMALGWLYKSQGKYSQAEEAFKKTSTLSPDRASRALAILYKEMGKPNIAQTYGTPESRHHIPPLTRYNYQKIKEILNKRGVKLICAQYPMRSVEPLKEIFEGQEGVILVDNEKVFKEALEKSSYNEYFIDMFGGDFGHCTRKGNKLLAENIANTILKEHLNR